jgi:hypothetical protein
VIGLRDSDDHFKKCFAETKFVVEATDFEQYCLWEKHHEQVKWEQVSPGMWETIGYFGKMPVCVSCSWVRINGHIVLFYEAVSMVTHSEMVERWVEKMTKSTPTWGGGRQAHTNAMNFHHCLDALKGL